MHHICCGKLPYCLYKFGEPQITPAVLWNNIHKSLYISQSLYGIHAFIGLQSQVLPKVSLVLWHASKCYHNNSHDSPLKVFRDSSDPESQPECPSRVSFARTIHSSMFTLCVLSHTPRRSQWLKYILLMSFVQKTFSNCVAVWTWQYLNGNSSKKSTHMSSLLWLASLWTLYNHLDAVHCTARCTSILMWQWMAQLGLHCE